MRNADWRDFSQRARLQIDGDAIRASTGKGREQLVQVDEAADSLSVWSKILPPHQVDAVPQLETAIFAVNRLSELVSLRIDRRGWLVGEAWVPHAGLTAQEWRFYVQKVATVCDRMEQILAGVDKQ